GGYHPLLPQPSALWNFRISVEALQNCDCLVHCLRLSLLASCFPGYFNLLRFTKHSPVNNRISHQKDFARKGRVREEISTTDGGRDLHGQRLIEIIRRIAVIDESGRKLLYSSIDNYRAPHSETGKCYHLNVLAYWSPFVSLLCTRKKSFM